MPTLRELSELYARRQPGQVDLLTEQAPILDAMNFQEASHGMWNVYEKLNEVDGAGFVDMDAVLPTMKSDGKPERVDLDVMGGKITIGEDKAQMFGGMVKYFASKMPSILRKTGQTTETRILYNNLRQFAIDTGGNNKINAGGSSNANYTMLAVRWVEGETTGLYSPEGFKNGATLDQKFINNGAMYEIDSAGRLGYGMRLKGYFGMQLGNPQTVAGIFNIDSSNKPTETEIDDLLDAVRADDNTFLYCHRKVLTMLNSYKGDALRLSNGNNAIDRRIGEWNGVPIITSYNFKDATETDVSFA